MDGAALVGRLSMIQFLHEHRNEGGTTREIDGAAWRGHVHVVAFLVRNRLEGCTSKALDTACQHGDMEIVRVLHESVKASCTPADMDMAASNDNRVEVCTENAMADAAINGHTDVVCFLGEHRHEGIHDFALERTAAQGHVECVKALIRYSMRVCLFEARRAALEAAYPELAEVLSTYINPDSAASNETSGRARAQTEALQTLRDAFTQAKKMVKTLVRHVEHLERARTEQAQALTDADALLPRYAREKEAVECKFQDAVRIEQAMKTL
ncbi:hypothetical protein PsorP6_016348 [Peronosclerospora sorghi]|uniref:Uncharacterized protein n=1 Tax=Peronosclerospora sorghi TaxID=230839 RepID=A0ACC0VMA1_9STRA|nr:hypothetical protein PsorP6_016348 [Peronosclerospora sorghi]